MWGGVREWIITYVFFVEAACFWRLHWWYKQLCFGVCTGGICDVHIRFQHCLCNALFYFKTNFFFDHDRPTVTWIWINFIFAGR
jgi:hypothetical protein